MSDLLAAVSYLATGGLLILGNMVFEGFELPERVSVGGQLQNTIHKLPGGNRVVDTTGPDPGPISWNGLFIGPFHEARRSMLIAIRDAGKPVDLIVKDQSYIVLVASVQLQEQFGRADYTVQCIVLPDPGPEEEDDDTGALGDGEPPDTPQKAQEQGQAKVAASRKIAAKMPSAKPASQGSPIGPPAPSEEWSRPSEEWNRPGAVR